MTVQSLSEVREIIVDLWHQRAVTAMDLLESLRGTEVAARNDYAGRVIFEFFQNAIDRAEHRIEMQLEIEPSGESARLIFANDGEPVSIRTGTDGPGPTPKSDFHSLCAIFRSDKKPGETIGNKGIGFKSGWEFARQATIISTLSGPEQVRWGFRLHQPLDAEALKAGSFWQELGTGPENERQLRTRVEECVCALGRAPSFLFPEFIGDAQAHLGSFGWATTAIIMDGIAGKEKIAQLESLMEEFRGAHLFFVQQLCRRKGKELTVTTRVVKNGEVDEFQQSTAPGDWTVVAASDATLPGWEARREQLAAEAAKLNFGITRPSLALAFAPPKEEKGKGGEPRFFCYLPTQVEVPVRGRVHIHADFLLDIARKHIADNGYNRELLKEAARLLARSVAEHPSLYQRDDAPLFLARGADSQLSTFTDELERLLFAETGEGDHPPWSVTYLGKALASTPCPELRHDNALGFVQSWCYQASRERGSTTKERRDKRLRLLAKHEVPLVPLSVERGMVLERTGLSAEENFSLFLRKRSGDVPLKDLDILTSRVFSGIGVSTWGELEKYSSFGVKEFRFDQVIASVRRAVRQCFAGESTPVKPKTESELGFSPLKLLNLIVALRLEGDSDSIGEPLQYLGKKGATPTVAQDLAWLPLPVAGDKWLPAFRVLLSSAIPVAEDNKALRNELLTIRGFQVLDEERMAFLSAFFRCGASAKSIAAEIGAWPCLPLDLCRPDSDFSLPFALRTAADDYRVARGVLKALSQAWPRWSAPDLKNRERLVGVLEELRGETAWFPLPALGRCVPVPEVLLTRGTPLRAEFLYEYRSEGEKEALLLADLGICLPEEAAPDRLVRVLKKMERFLPNTDQLRGRYRTLMEALSGQRETAQHGALPLLVSRGRRLAWRAEGDDRPVWFAGRRNLTWRNHFAGHADFLELRPDVSAEWIKSLGVAVFEPIVTPRCSGYMRADHQLREAIAGVLPYLILVAENSRAGANGTEEKVSEKWQRLHFKQGADVSQKVTFGGIEKFVGERTDADTRQRDVVLVSEGNVVEIWHDLDDPTSDLPVFAGVLAQALFRNILLADPFEVCLSRSGVQRDEWIHERYGVTPEQVRALQNEMKQNELDSDTLGNIVTALRELLPSVDDEEIRSRWWDVSLYLEEKIPFSSEEVLLRLPDQAGKLCDLDPSCHNANAWRTDCRQYADRIARAWFCDHLQNKPELVHELRSKLIEADTVSFPLGEAVARFDFDTHSHLAGMLRVEPWLAPIAPGESLEEWLSRKEADQVAWLRAEQLERCSAQKIDVQRWTVLSGQPDVHFEVLRQDVETDAEQPQVKVFKQTQESRQKEQLGKQLRGETAEMLLALETVTTLLTDPALTDEKKVALWDELRSNWQKITFADTEARDAWPAVMPQTPKELLHHLHVAKRLGDGLGFDIICYVEDDGGLLAFVEVKDISAGAIHLSENERLRALQLRNAGVPWRLYGFVKGSGWRDLSQLVLEQAGEVEKQMPSLRGLRPKEWVMQIKKASDSSTSAG